MTERNTSQSEQNGGRDAQGRFTKGNSHAFQPGQSGNPKGRPKAITLSEAYRRELAKLDPNDSEGRTFAEVLAEQTILKAKGGDVAALREIADRVEGKAKQTVTLTMDQRDKFERAVAGIMEETGCSREEAIETLSLFKPEVSQLTQ